jgi:hypothetical protein
MEKEIIKRIWEIAFRDSTTADKECDFSKESLEKLVDRISDLKGMLKSVLED